MFKKISDTIAAIATALGESGIGIVRISGDKAIDVAENIIKLKSNKPLNKIKTHTISLGYIIDPITKTTVDEVLVSIMRAPNTYTKEDIVEINCHGGIMALRKTLKLVLDSGARLAEPGEFTKRAFLNGRIDLVQAEAVIDVIKSKSEAGLKAAVSQLEGGLSNLINNIAEKLEEVLVQIEASVDFSDEDIETLNKEDIIEILEESRKISEELFKSAFKGRVLKEGIKTAIIGRPNVGKSSILNALLKTQRAIVTEIPGTTRDIIEEAININGITLVLQDTAGLRETKDKVEQIGVNLTKNAIKNAEMILCVIDGSKELQEEDICLINEIKQIRNKEKDNVILVINKTDLSLDKTIENYQPPQFINSCVKTSANTGFGLDDLKEQITAIIFNNKISTEEIVITNTRHEYLLEKTLDKINEAIDLIKNCAPEEIVALIIKEAIENLNEVTGRKVGEDILGKIFSQFCIGK